MEQYKPLQSPLLGALIGLSRASYGTPYPTEGALRMMMTLLAQSPLPEGEVLLSALHREKQRLAPDCATCGAPCGRTADFDPSALADSTEEVLSLKCEILSGLHRLAQAACREQDTARLQRLLPFFADGLFCLGEDWTPAELQPTLDELRELSADL